VRAFLDAHREGRLLTDVVEDRPFREQRRSVGAGLLGERHEVRAWAQDRDLLAGVVLTAQVAKPAGDRQAQQVVGAAVLDRRPHRRQEVVGDLG
jgi:hypothetical protein